MAQDDAGELLATLGRLATSLGPAVRPVGTEGLLASITQSARLLFGARACSLALVSEDGRELEYTTASGDGADGITGMRIPVSSGIAGWVVATGEAAVIADVSADPRFARGVAQDTGYIPRSMVAVPVLAQGEVLGVLTLLDRDAARPGAEHDLALLAVFAEQTALTLQNERAFRRLGRVLLEALAAAAQEGTALQVQLAGAAQELPAADADLAELAAVFATLDRQGVEERRLAVRLVREVSAYTRRRSPRSGR